jgi:uncharacterized protein DUF4136
MGTEMTKVRASLAMLLFVALTATVASAQKVTTDFEKKADFSRYKTLTAKGWQSATENADVAAMANGAAKDQQTLDTFYTGFSGWRLSWAGDTMATTQVEHYTVGTLEIDLFDAKTKQAIFRGVATDTLSDKPEKNEDN